MRISDWSSDGCSSDLVRTNFFTQFVLECQASFTGIVLGDLENVINGRIMRFVNRDDFPSIAIDLMFEDIDDVGVWFCSAGREPQSSDTNGFLCTIAILVGIEVAQPNDSFFESVVAFRGVCSDALSCEMISQFREELQQLRTRERNVRAGRADAEQEGGGGN